MQPRGAALVALLACGLGLGCASASAESQAEAEGVISGRTPTIYRWVDSDGVAHYTADPDRIPANVRSQIATPSTEPAPERPAARAPSERWIATDAPPEIGGAQVGEAGLPGPGAETTDPPGAAGPGAGGAPTGASERPPARRVAARPDPAREAERAALDAEIAALEARITEDEEALKDLLDEPTTESDALAVKPAFRELALRLPKLQSQLRALRERRAQLDGS